MTLKEKFEQVESPVAIGLEKIADGYAIEFAQWVQFHSELWIKYKTSELLAIFKKEKGL